jgi:type III secretion system low calcium response chaperone LcrH/SycD
MKGEEKEVTNAAKELGKAVDKETMARANKILESMLVKGKLPREALGFTAAKMDSIYSQAYRLYNTGRYKEAVQLFRTLVLLDSTDSKYTLGLAACAHMMKEYMSAVQLYLYAAMIDPKNPVPHFHASDCYLQMRDKPSALISLEMAVKLAGSRTEYQILKDRSLLTIESLKKDIFHKK